MLLVAGRLKAAARPRDMVAIADPEVMVGIHAYIDHRFRVARPSLKHVRRVPFVAAEEVEQVPGYVPTPP